MYVSGQGVERFAARPAYLDPGRRPRGSGWGRVGVWAGQTPGGRLAAVYRGGQPSRLLCLGPCRPDYCPGAGSILEGNPIPVRGGIVLNLSRMDAIVEVHQEDLQVSVQPGIVYQRLNEQLSPWGLFFPPSPGGSSDVATIGGMVANNASGIYSVKYGGTREHVKAATVVTGSGQVLDLGTRCRKTSSGYHLLGLVVGSEGTLAIATQLTLSLAGLPQGRKQDTLRFSTRRTRRPLLRQ